MKIIDNNPDWIQTEIDKKSGVLYLIGRCIKCREHFILKFTGAHKYKCPKCRNEFVVRRER